MKRFRGQSLAAALALCCCGALVQGGCGTTSNPVYVGDASSTDGGGSDAPGQSGDDGGTTSAEGGVTDDAPVDPGGLDRFSFFVTSLAALQRLSGSQDGFGGDLRFGETGPGAGLRGADKICATIAEASMPGATTKQWRAFLSVTADEDGKPVDAIDRIGDGPWYDRLGRLVAPTKADLVNERPENGDPAIADDLPNEDGVPNHQPDPTQPPVDNHHMLTGSNDRGTLESATATCKDWTTADGAAENGRPEGGFSWPRIRPGGLPPKPGGDKGGTHWITGVSAPGCAAGVSIVQTGGALPGEVFVGAGGGYGGFYCFALVP